MEDFTPITSLVGGILVGASASILWLAEGKVAGISGMLGGLVRPRDDDTLWRATFLAGLIAGGVVLRVHDPATLEIAIDRSTAATVLAGLLVGFGTRLGNGCTSGHGVCGISRGSARSLAATGTFMLVGAVVTAIVRHVFGGAV